MFSAIQFLRNSLVLSWTVIESLFDYRRLSSSHSPTATEQADWMHRWCGTALSRLGVKVEIDGTIPRRGLIVSNHLSYLDIFAFGTAMPCVFVSKAEVRDWPVFGTLTTIAGTVYIDRSRRRDTRNANAGIRRALEEELRVVVFPEGTSTDGTGVLPFYPSLFEPVVEAAMPIFAARIAYTVEDGSVARDVAFVGDTKFLPHLLKLLSKHGVSARVTFAPTPRTFSDRKIAAVAMREEVLRLREVRVNG
jgi:1-acyl-sn-glycerol-3-phosphate acyltransferase